LRRTTLEIRGVVQWAKLHHEVQNLRARVNQK
jgi:hypothetical protein